MFRWRASTTPPGLRLRQVRRISSPTISSVKLGQAALTLLYRLYESHLLSNVRRHSVPRHVGLILDGNRRYGRQHKLTEPRAIYAAGAEKLDDLLSWCAELAIPAITLWVFSTDNFDRRPEEISGILAAVEAKLAMLARDPRIHQRKVRVRAVGRLVRGSFLDADTPTHRVKIARRNTSIAAS